MHTLYSISSHYTPFSGYGPSDTKAEKDLDDNGSTKKASRDGGWCFLAGTINSDPLKREHAPLKTKFSWSCDQVKCLFVSFCQHFFHKFYFSIVTWWRLTSL